MKKAIEIHGAQVEVKRFPGGEWHPTVLDLQLNSVAVNVIPRNMDEMFLAMLIIEAIKRKHPYTMVTLTVCYMPYARQDRVALTGEAFGLVLSANLLKYMASGLVYKLNIVDPHSNVTPALLDGFNKHGIFEVIDQYSIQRPILEDLVSEGDWVMLAPDSGAVTKSQATARKLKLPLAYATKKRDARTGKLSHSEVIDGLSAIAPNGPLASPPINVLVTDDICDGGGTFLLLVDAVAKVNPKAKLHLVVTHGIFSKGKEVLLEKYETVQAIYDWTEIEGTI